MGYAVGKVTWLVTFIEYAELLCERPAFVGEQRISDFVFGTEFLKHFWTVVSSGGYAYAEFLEGGQGF